jgi:polysaccharide export outer membrane protein
LYRRGKQEGQTSTIDIRLGRILKAGDLGTNVAVLPGDVITVPERAF